MNFNLLEHPIFINYLKYTEDNDIQLNEEFFDTQYHSNPSKQFIDYIVSIIQKYAKILHPELLFMTYKIKSSNPNIRIIISICINNNKSISEFINNIQDMHLLKYLIYNQYYILDTLIKTINKKLINPDMHENFTHYFNHINFLKNYFKLSEITTDTEYTETYTPFVTNNNDEEDDTEETILEFEKALAVPSIIDNKSNIEKKLENKVSVYNPELEELQKEKEKYSQKEKTAIPSMDDFFGIKKIPPAGN